MGDKRANTSGPEEGGGIRSPREPREPRTAGDPRPPVRSVVQGPRRLQGRCARASAATVGAVYVTALYFIFQSKIGRLEATSQGVRETQLGRLGTGDGRLALCSGFHVPTPDLARAAASQAPGAPAPQPPRSRASLPPGVPQRRAGGLPRRQPPQAQPLVPLSVGSGSSEKRTRQRRGGNLGSPSLPTRAGPGCGQTSHFTRGPCPRRPPRPPSGGPRTRRGGRPRRPPCAPLQRCAASSSPSCGLGQRCAPPGHSGCQPPFPCFLMTQILCPGHIHMGNTMCHRSK